MIYGNSIRQWAEERNLIAGSTVQAVVLTILAAQKNLEIEECVVHAWHQIKDRKGRMVDGIFVKEESDV